jgi:hypothetical protein
MLTEEAYYGGSTVLVLAAEHYMSPTEKRIILVSTSGGAQTLRLPFAPYLMLGGYLYCIINSGPDIVTVKDIVGSTLQALSANQAAKFHLYANATAGGSWASTKYTGVTAQADDAASEYIYVMGGKSGTQDCYEYNQRTDAWTKKSSPTREHANACGSVRGNTETDAYIVGSSTGADKQATDEYDPDTWTTKASYNFNLSYSAASPRSSGIGGRITVSGGAEHGTRTQEWLGSNWASVTSRPNNAMLHAAATDKNAYNAYFFNGVTTASAYNNLTDQWNGSAWTSKTARTAPFLKSIAAVTVASDVIHIVGGVNGDLVYSKHFKYDVSGNSWTTKPALPEPRFSGGSGLADGKMFYIAGRATLFAGGARDTVYRYNPSTAAWDTRPRQPMPVTKQNVRESTIEVTP